MTAVHDLATLLAAIPANNGPPPSVRKALVTAIDSGTDRITVTLSGATVAGVAHLSSYVPRVNDVVFILITDGAVIALGTVRTATDLAPRGVIDHHRDIRTDYTRAPSQTGLAGMSRVLSMTAGRRYRLTAQAHLGAATGPTTIYGTIHEDGVEKGRFGVHPHEAGNVIMYEGSAIFSTSAGNHTYELRTASDGGDITVISSIGIWMLLEDIGAA